MPLRNLIDATDDIDLSSLIEIANTIAITTGLASEMQRRTYVIIYVILACPVSRKETSLRTSFLRMGYPSIALGFAMLNELVSMKMSDESCSE